MFKKVLGLSLASAGLLGFSTANAVSLDFPMSVNQTEAIFKEDWTSRINLSGLVMGELIMSNYNQANSSRFGDKRHYQTFCFPRAVLNVDSQLNDWVNGHISLNFRSSCGFGGKNDEWAFANFGTTSEAYVDLGNTNVKDYSARIGIQYLPYGLYKRNVIPATLTQLLTQSQAAGATGFAKVTDSFDVAAFLFSGKKRRNDSVKIKNFGFQGFGKVAVNDIKMKVTAGYMYNIAGGVNYLYYESSSSTANPLKDGYRKVVSGASLTLDAEIPNGWHANFRYTGALKKFDSQDVAWGGQGAKPKAYVFGIAKSLDVNLFDTELASTISASYQQSSQSVNLRGGGLGRGLPKRRYQVGYGIEFNEYFETALNLIKDTDYNSTSGGTGRGSYAALLSAVLKIS